MSVDYYVTHPSLGISATVSAPTTEKARTTFLDYLERNGKIPRSERHTLRRNMVVERLKDPNEVSTDLTLHYGYEETHEPLSLQESGAVVPLPPQEVVVPELPQQQEQPMPQQSKMSPIQELVVTGRVSQNAS